MDRTIQKLIKNAKVVKLLSTEDIYIIQLEVGDLSRSDIMKYFENVRNTIMEIAPDLHFIMAPMYSGECTIDCTTLETIRKNMN